MPFKCRVFFVGLRIIWHIFIIINATEWICWWNYKILVLNKRPLKKWHVFWFFLLKKKAQKWPLHRTCIHLKYKWTIQNKPIWYLLQLLSKIIRFGKSSVKFPTLNSSFFIIIPAYFEKLDPYGKRFYYYISEKRMNHTKLCSLKNNNKSFQNYSNLRRRW